MVLVRKISASSIDKWSEVRTVKNTYNTYKTMFVFVLSLLFASAVQAQLSLSGAIYSEEKTSFEAPSNLGMYIYAYEGRELLGSYDASSGIQPSVIRGVNLEIMLINFNINLEEISLRFVSPAILADLKQLEKMTKEDEGWSVGKKSDTAYLFYVNTIDLSGGHCVAILRCKVKTRTRHSVIVVFRWVTTGREVKDKGFALMVQDLPPNAWNVSMQQLMQMGKFSGFRSRFVSLPEDPMKMMKIMNQVIPGQNSSAQQTVNVLPPDLDLPDTSALSAKQETDLPPDLALPEPNFISIAAQFSDRFDDFEDGKLAKNELEKAMQNPNKDKYIEVYGKEAVIYVWSDDPFKGVIRRGDKSVELKVFRHPDGTYWARLNGPSDTLTGATLDIKSGTTTRTTKFIQEVN